MTNVYIPLCNHHPMQDTFPSPKKGSLRALLQLVLPPSWPQAMTSAFYNYRFDECFLELDINRVAQHVVVFLCLASATQHNDFEIHLHFEIHQRRMYQWFVSFRCWAVFHCVDILQLAYPVTCWWTFGLSQCFLYKWSCCEHSLHGHT